MSSSVSATLITVLGLTSTSVTRTNWTALYAKLTPPLHYFNLTSAPSASSSSGPVALASNTTTTPLLLDDTNDADVASVLSEPAIACLSSHQQPNIMVWLIASFFMQLYITTFMNVWKQARAEQQDETKSELKRACKKHVLATAALISWLCVVRVFGG